MRQDTQVSMRVSSKLLDRADALVPKIEADEELNPLGQSVKRGTVPCWQPKRRRRAPPGASREAPKEMPGERRRASGTPANP